MPNNPAFLTEEQQMQVLTLLGYVEPYMWFDEHGGYVYDARAKINKAFEAYNVSQISNLLLAYEANELRLEQVKDKVHVKQLDEIKVDYLRQYMLVIADLRRIIKSISRLVNLPVIASAYLNEVRTHLV